jgi:hypothetical protein
MEPDLELETWRRGWQASTVIPSDLSQRVERETRTMRRFVAGEVAVTLAFGGGSLVWAVLSRRTDVIVLAVGVWAFLAMAWTISLLLRRGAWTPLGTTTTAFLELSILRCRRRRESIVAQAVLYLMILAFDLTWIYFARTPASRPHLLTFLTADSLLWVWAITVVLVIVAVWQRHRLDRELDTLMTLRQQIAGSRTRAESEGGYAA